MDMPETQDILESTYLTAVEHAGVGIVITTLDGRIRANKAFWDMLGFTQEESKNCWQEVTYQEDIAPSQAILDDLASGKIETGYWEKRYYHKNGSIIWASMTSVMYRDESGEPLHYITTVMDNTEKKLNEAELIKLNRLYAMISQANQLIVRCRNIEELLPGISQITVEFGGFRMAWVGLVNEKTHTVKPVAWCGYNDDYLANIKISTLDIPEGRGPTGTCIRTKHWVTSNDFQNDPKMEVWRKDALLRGYNSSLALPIIIKGKAIGAFMLYSTEAFFFNEAEINLMVSITEDIAYAMEMLDAEKKRKQNEQALQESENRYRNLIMQSPDAIFVNMNNKVSLVNQACLKLFGAKEENELLGKSIFSLFHPDFHEKISERISILSEKDQSVPLIEERIIRMDGSYLDVDVLAAPFHYMGENGIHVVLRDISIRKQAALKAINDTLEQKVKERTAQLSEAVKELEAFSYSVSHDLRTPLRGIDGWSWVLLEDYDDILDGQSKEYLGFIRSEAQRMGQTIDSLLKLAKMNITEMQEQEVDVSVLARNSILHLKSMKPERQVEMAIEPNLYVKGDQSQLDLVISNLVGNAWKFTAVKEIARLEFGTIRQNDEQVFYLKDNGIGFDMTYYNKLFQPFQRLHNDIEYPGTGIGLAIIKRIIKRHGGRVWAEGCVGGGATFFFTLWGKDSKTQELENPS